MQDIWTIYKECQLIQIYISLYNIFLCMRCWISPLLNIRVRTFCTDLSGYFWNTNWSSIFKITEFTQDKLKIKGHSLHNGHNNWFPSLSNFKRSSHNLRKETSSITLELFLCLSFFLRYTSLRGRSTGTYNSTCF